MSKKDKKQSIQKVEEEKIQSDVEQKIDEIMKLLVDIPSNEKLNEINLNYQSLKTQLEDGQNKISDISKNLEDVLNNIREIEKVIADLKKYKEDIYLKYEELKSLGTYIDYIIQKLEFIEELKRDYPHLKEKYPLIDHIISKISLLDDSLIEKKSQMENFKQILENLEREIKYIQDKIENRMDSKITEFFENYQSRVDEAQTLKLIELEEKLNSTISETEKKVENKIIEYVVNVQSQIDYAQTQKLIELEEKLKDIINTHSKEHQEIIIQTQESLKNQINETILDKLGIIINNYKESLLPEIKDKIKEIEEKIEPKITEFFENYQSRVDEAQTLKLIELEEKLNSTVSETEKKVENKIIEYVVNVQSQIDYAQTQKLIELEEKLKDIINTHSKEHQEIIIQTQESLKNQINETILDKLGIIINNYKEFLLPEIKDKIKEIEEKLERIEIIDNLKSEIDSEQTQKILQIETKLQDLIKQSATQIYDEVINSIRENEEKHVKLVSSLEENTNKSIDKILTDFNKIQEKNNEIGLKIENLNQKYEDFVNLVNNISDRITSIFIKPDQETEQMEYTENLPFDLNKLIELMNRPDLQAENLFIKSGNRPILKSPRATAAIGKTSLKNGDVFNFLTQLFNPNEIKHLQIQSNINKIKTINNEKYYLNAQKILDDYVLVIKKIPYATNDISILPIVNPEKLISKISNLVLFLGVNNLKNTALSTLVNYINQKQIKRIAIIEEKINHLYKESQSIIDIFEHKGNEDNLNDILRKVLNDEYDIIILSSNSLDKKIVKMVANHSSYKTFILNLGYDNILSFYKEYKDISEDILKSLNIYITHKSIRNELHLLEIVFIDNKIKGLIKSEDHKAIREYIISIEESDTQTFNESIAYLVKTGKITKEEAMKYLSNLDEIEKSVKQEQQIEL